MVETCIIVGGSLNVILFVKNKNMSAASVSDRGSDVVSSLDPITTWLSSKSAAPQSAPP